MKYGHNYYIFFRRLPFITWSLNFEHRYTLQSDKDPCWSKANIATASDTCYHVEPIYVIGLLTFYLVSWRYGSASKRLQSRVSFIFPPSCSNLGRYRWIYFSYSETDHMRYQIRSATWDFQLCGMCNQQSLRSACAYAQSGQSLC